MVQDSLQVKQTLQTAQYISASPVAANDTTPSIYSANTQNSEVSAVDNNKLETAVNEIKAKFSKLNLSNQEIKNLLNIFTTNTNNQNLAKAKENVIRTITYVQKNQKNAKFNDFANEARKFATVISMGWDSVDSFLKANKKNDENIVERIQRIDGDKDKNPKWVAIRNKLGIHKYNGADISSLPKEEQLEFLKSYLNYVKDESAKKVEAGKITAEQASIYAKTDIAKLIYNSADVVSEDVIISFLSCVDKELTAAAINTYINASDDTAAAADKFTLNVRIEIFNTADCSGNVSTTEQIADGQSVITTYQSEEGRLLSIEQVKTNEQEIYTPENIKRFNEIQKKIQNNQEISEEDKKFYAEFVRNSEIYSGINQGSIRGTLERTDLSDAVKAAEIGEINYNTQTYANPIYEDVISGIANHYENAEISEIQKAAYETILNKATNNNYEIVKNGGTAEDLNAPVKPAETKTQSEKVSAEQTNSTTSTTEVNNNTADSNTSNNIADAQPVQEVQPIGSQRQDFVSDSSKSNKSNNNSDKNLSSSAAIAKAVKSGVEGVKEYAEKNDLNAIDIITVFAKVAANNHPVLDYLCDLYKSMSADIQRITISSVNNIAVLKKFIECMKNSLLCEYKGNSSLENELLANETEKREENGQLNFYNEHIENGGLFITENKFQHQKRNSVFS